MSNDLGPHIPHYNSPLDFPFLYEWIPGNTATADNVAVLSHNGGTVGRWHLVRANVLGANLTDANENLTVGGNFFRVLPAATLTASRTKTAQTTNAAAGDVIHVLRLDTTANTLIIANGGLGGGTIYTLPASQSWWAKIYFDGTNWIAHSAGQNP